MEGHDIKYPQQFIYTKKNILSRKVGHYPFIFVGQILKDKYGRGNNFTSDA